MAPKGVISSQMQPCLTSRRAHFQGCIIIPSQGHGLQCGAVLRLPATWLVARSHWRSWRPCSEGFSSRLDWDFPWNLVYFLFKVRERKKYPLTSLASRKADLYPVIKNFFQILFYAGQSGGHFGLRNTERLCDFPLTLALEQILGENDQVYLGHIHEVVKQFRV